MFRELGRRVFTLSTINKSMSRFSYRCTNQTNWKRTFSIKAESEADEEPIKFSTSRAAMPIPKPPELPWYHPYIVLFSWTVFGIYFGILREENDIDLMLSADLSDHLPQFKQKT